MSGSVAESIHVDYDEAQDNLPVGLREARNIPTQTERVLHMAGFAIAKGLDKVFDIKGRGRSHDSL